MNHYQPFFFEQMVQLINTPVQILDCELNRIQGFGLQKNVNLFFDTNKELFRQLYNEKQEYPVISAKKELVFAVFGGGMEDNKALIVGPVTFGMLMRDELREYMMEYKVDEKNMFQPPVCTLQRFVSGVKMIHWHLTGKEMTAAQLWKQNESSYSMTLNIQEQVSQDFFSQQEGERLHNPYEQELRELDSIEKGDVEALTRSISETYAGEIGKLAKNPLRSHKNVAVGNITLASRAAIRGGVSVEKSFSMADSFIRQIEEIRSIPEVESFKRKSQYEYTRMVKEENSHGNEGQNSVKNPLVAQTKDYIFSHLHESIQVADIASDMQVNADYLSHLFSLQEGMTITGYIRQEKIKRGENLLKYSDYKVQEIAFYLGFCSQSHFSREFAKKVGMNPNEYRRKFGNQMKWKIK